MPTHPIKITIENGYYVMRSRYDERLTANVKALPKSLRAWDPDKRAWVISPKASELLMSAILRSGYEAPDMPAFEATAAIAEIVQKTLTVEYVGMCKDRGESAITALGSVKGFWSVEFPEAVLKTWFERKTTADNVQTFYQVLCVFESASEQEIKSAHRRLARQWHPDVCSEPEASDKFRELTDAYEILRDPPKRKRYDAGLFFERESKKTPEPNQEINFARGYRIGGRFANPHFRAPLRCGLITAEGTQKLSRFTVSKIISWDDITDGADRVMTSSWNKFTESIEIKWI
jgi:DnaJ-domain-containing protein 1